jgi:hypothetical protein
MGTASVPNWQASIAGSGWGLSGNSGINPSTQFIGTTDNHPLLFRINNQWAGIIDSANTNTHIGYQGGKNTLPLFGYNTGFGYNHLRLNTQGSGNTAIGTVTMYSNTTGSANTVIGEEGLYSNQTGDYNNANGAAALYANVSGSFNTADGALALKLNTTGADNTAIGFRAMGSNISGAGNTAIGFDALTNNSSGKWNTALGQEALIGNAGSLASYNTAVGVLSLANTSNSQYNTAIGYHAGSAYDNGYNNVFVGANTDVNGAGYYNVIAIGQGTIVGGSSVARFGNSATVSYGGWANWSNVSDGRLKKDVRENVSGLSFILKLRPVTYHLSLTGNSQLLRQTAGKVPDDRMQAAIKEKEQILYSGFIAQEVEKAAGDLGYDFSGVDKPKDENDMYGLRYADFVVPLVKAVQEQQQLMDKMQKKIDALEQQNKLLQQLISNKK